MSGPSNHTAPVLNVRSPANHSEMGRKDTPAVCGGCDARWYGKTMAHCSACHRTFGSVDLFDIHRTQNGQHGMCEDPEMLKASRKAGAAAGQRLMILVGGVWRAPGRDWE